MANTCEARPWIAPLMETPVAVFGYGESGRAAEALLHSMGVSIEVFDEAGNEGATGDFTREDAARFRLAVCSPGFRFDHPWFEIAREAGLVLAPETDLGASFWKGPIVAVTGTNGKTTLVEFLEKAFRSAGMEAYGCGNIGLPMSRLIADKHNPEAIAVCEASSFQGAMSKHLHADYVLWTNIDEDHLDRHGSMKSYFESKYNLVQLMRGKDFLYDDSVARRATSFGYELDADGLVKNDRSSRELGICGTVFETLPEKYTYLMGRALWLRMGLSEAELIEAAHTFQKSPHRMELILSEKGISYWDDSKATNFHAVYGALSRFENPVVWIGGGKMKGGDVGRFARNVAGSLKTAHIIGESKELLAAAFGEQGVETRVYDSLEDAVTGARDAAIPGDTILLSPGFASLDMFESYSQRGEVFRKAVNSLEEK